MLKSAKDTDVGPTTAGILNNLILTLYENDKTDIFMGMKRVGEMTATVFIKVAVGPFGKKN